MSNPQLLIGTNNQGKVSEFRRLLAGVAYDLCTPADLGITLTVPEDGLTFKANAVAKARAFSEASGLLTLADDSGIEVAALDGRPGVHSARYGGPGLTDEERVAFLLRELADVPPDRRACRYVAVLALAWPNGSLDGHPNGGPDDRPDGRIEICVGTCTGRVAAEPVGTGGFGYDPVFYVPGPAMTVAEMSPEAKDAISHRGQAARQAVIVLRRAAPAAAG